MTESKPVRIREMPWEEMRKLLRKIGGEVATLATHGDKLALDVRARYQYAFEHPTDQKANWELRVAVEDYMNRDLRTGEQYDLASKYGHRLVDGKLH